MTETTYDRYLAKDKKQGELRSITKKARWWIYAAQCLDAETEDKAYNDYQACLRAFCRKWQDKDDTVIMLTMFEAINMTTYG